MSENPSVQNAENENTALENNSVQSNINSAQTAVTLKSNHVKIIITIVSIAFALIIASAIFAIGYITTENKKDKASDRINQICDDISSKEIYDFDCIAADGQLSEIDALIKENNLDGLPVSKYNDMVQYVADVKSYKKISELSYGIDYSIDKFRSLNQLFEGLKTDKIKSLAKDNFTYTLEDYAKRILSAKTIYDIQEIFKKEEADCRLTDIAVVKKDSSRSEVWGYDAEDVICLGIKNDTLASADSISDLSTITARIGQETLEELDSKNNGYGFGVVYKDEEGHGWTWFWYVGFELSYNIDNHTYNITGYADGKKSDMSWSSEEILHNKIFNIHL